MIDLYKPVLFSALERYGSFLFYLISAAILARLLSPLEFGICSIALALTNVLTGYFQEFGGGNYLIQKSVLTERNIRTAFTVTLVSFLCVALLLYVLSGVAARFFAQDGLQIGIAVCAINLALAPISVTISALLRREMAFAVLARCNLVANFVSSFSAVGFAMGGWSFLAPILGMLAGTIVYTALLLVCRPQHRILRPSLEGYREVFRFGAYSSSVVILNVFYQWFPQLMIGRILDFAAVGLYSRAVNITQLFDRAILQILNPVIMPAISARARAGGDLKSAYLVAMELLSVLQWPSLLFIALMSDTLILIWLGPTWIDVVPLVRALCIASLSMFAAPLTYPVLVAIGRVQDTLTSSLISLPPSLLITIAASFWGVQAVANVALIVFPFQAAVAIWFVARRLAISPAELMRAVSKSIVVTIFCMASALIGLFIITYSGAGPVVALLSAGFFASAGWLLALIITNHGLVVRMRTLTHVALAGRLSFH
ncbi:oligosaccharide flippase family protein [Bradyrhizobium sp. CSA112]|uniref:oligosaccharide flippase family protein n=1 Tax=Bradyrhizobium sp. CSA112 TaxID=2699170 RepID=UPI0023B07095|nr:oligosaccharide flippase family protein [Bradyrhizobium sp. CSA112]MDE5452797.1 oligosaccharide flippase family protein [Bradyrhizobium sp. CSA112]